MNQASAAIVSWLMEQRCVAESEGAELVSVLRKGVEKGEADSVILLEHLVAEATQAAKGTSQEQAISRLVSLHGQIREVDEAIGQVELLQAAREIIDLPAKGPIVERIKKQRLAALLKDKI